MQGAMYGETNQRGTLRVLLPIQRRSNSAEQRRDTRPTAKYTFTFTRLTRYAGEIVGYALDSTI
jgi:hypothetical protein